MKTVFLQPYMLKTTDDLYTRHTQSNIGFFQGRVWLPELSVLVSTTSS